MRRRDAITGAVLCVLLVVSVVVATSFGAVSLPFGKTASILWDGIAGSGTGDWAPWERTVLLTVRLPRVLLAALAGAGLAVTGAVMQGLFRNPMADPGVIGVSGGAAFGAVTALYVGGTAAALVAVPAAAFAGALVCALVVFALATSRGHTPVSTLLLAGIAVAGIASAMTSFVLSLALAEWEVGRQMLAWLMGELEGRTWQHLAMAAPMVLGGSAWLLVYARDLNVLLTGEESALSVGVDVPRVKRDLIVLTALVTGATVAVMGIVGFVGLMVPHIVRLLVGPDHRRLLPTCFLAGAVFLVWADMACRVLPLADLRLGVVTALTGGPFFLYLLLRHRRSVRTL